jgi:hypothetical protein
VTQIGQGHEAPGPVPRVLTFGSPTVGEVLAERYELSDHVNNDSLGRQLWRGVDVILRRPVAVVLRYPGGDSAEEMLTAAVAASRIVHPHLAGVYDAIDEGERAYVVREWVDGEALRDLVREEPLDADRAAAVTHAVAAAVAAIHATGMAHGNIHPGTVLVADDGRVVLTDARADEAATQECDIRVIGAVLYASLTGYWPRAEAGPTTLPDAPRDGSGAPVAPRQVRAGVPQYLDELATALLSPDVELPAADVLAGDLGRYVDEGEAALLAHEPLGFDAFHSGETTDPVRPVGRKILVGIVALLAIALTGMIAAAQVMNGQEQQGGNAAVGRTGTPTQPSGARAPVQVQVANVRIVDAPGGGRDEADRQPRKAIDQDLKTGWQTDAYKDRADFGGIKKGMGLLIDLGEAREVTNVEVQMQARGASLELRIGDADPGDSAEGDAAVVNAFKLVGEPKVDAPTQWVFGGPERPVRYLLVWVTNLPQVSPGQYQVSIQEIKVNAR